MVAVGGSVAETKARRSDPNVSALMVRSTAGRLRTRLTSDWGVMISSMSLSTGSAPDHP